LQLPFPEQACFVQALLLLPLTVLALRWMSVQRWQAVLARLAPIPPRGTGSRPEPSGVGTACASVPPAEARRQGARATARMLAAAARRSVPRPNCLHNSLVLWWLLRRQGMESELHLGGRKQNGRLEAHAWVEVDGQVLNEAGDVRERFTPFERAGAPGKASFR